MSSHQHDDQHENDIAIVGMATHLPDAPDARAFWRNLRAARESVRSFSEEELLAAGVPRGQLQAPGYVKSGVVLDGLADFDAEFFGLSPKEAAIMDPQHRHFLECAWEALEDAGHDPARFDGLIGVFAGCGMGAYMAYNLLTNQRLLDTVGFFLLRHTGNDKDFLATRASYCFDLKGPSVNVQTACSTSLVAVHLASQSLLSGECDMALAGGVTIEIPHARGYVFKKGEILSPDGHCRAFDHRSEGTIFGSGAAVVVLRRLEDALADGDHVYAVVKGSAINNDGARKVGYLAPSVDGQAAAVAEAIAVSGIEAGTIGYVEAHGTGTPIGDPIEVAAMTQAFRETAPGRGFCGIGSVKSNIGHLDTAAGVTGLIKVALALHHRELPPTLHFEAPNRAIDFDASPFRVQAELAPWPADGAPRRGGVNSLGVGGTNAFAVLEEAPARSPSTRSRRSHQPLLLAARNSAALDAYGERLAAHLEAHPEEDLADVAYTLLVGRHRFEQRRVLACRDRDEALELLRARDPARVIDQAAPSDRPSVAFMFPGGGAQYPRMGRELYETEPVYREWVDRGLDVLRERHQLDLRPLLFGEEAQDEEVRQQFERPSLQLPAIFLVEYALARLWMSLGVEPAALIGHSMGENTAACVADVLDFEDGLGLVVLRGRLFERITGGGMLSVPLSPEELLPLLGDELDLATVNAPQLCVASGPAEAVDRLEARLAEQEVDSRRVKISLAAHSRMLTPIEGEFGAFLKQIGLRAPRIPFVSNLTGDWITDAQATDPNYWVKHLRQTIRFADGVGTLLQEPGRVLLEVGPGRTLSSLARQHSAMRAGVPAFSSLRHPDEQVSDAAYLTTVLGRLVACDVPIDAGRIWPEETRRRVPLPGYAFQRRRYWIEPGRIGAGDAHDALLPERVEDPERWFHEPRWREAPPPAAAEVAPGSTWLVFLDSAGLGEALCRGLEEAGDHVVRVHESDAYQRRPDGDYDLSPEQGRAGYDALVSDLYAAGTVPSGIVHLWSVTPAGGVRAGSSAFHHNLERGFYSLLFLMQALGQEGPPSPLKVAVVTSGSVRVGDEPLDHPEKATVMGPCRVVPREFPGATCTLIDLEPATPAANGAAPAGLGRLFTRRAAHAAAHAAAGTSDPAAAVLAELRAAAGTRTVALRGGRRLELDYERRAAPARPEGIPAMLRERGVYVITGGLGGLGLLVAGFLARRVGARLVLVSRTPLPAREDWDAWLVEHGPEDSSAQRILRLRELEAMGAEVCVEPADVSDVEGLTELFARVKQRFGALNGVFHAAGTIDDALILEKGQLEVERVFTPKVHGTLVLDALTRESELDFVLLFSSTSTFTAPVGQVDYVAANCFLDAYAQARRGKGGPRVLAVDWGVWRDVGMAAASVRRVEGGGSRPVSARPEPVESPLFAQVAVESDDRRAVIARLSPDRDWVLDQHRTSDGRAVLPGSAYVELTLEAMDLAGERAAWELRDLVFFRPFFVDDGSERELRAELTRDVRGYGIEFLGGAADGTYETLAQARIAFPGGERPAPVQLDLLRDRLASAGGPEDLGQLWRRQSEHLQLGPRWDVLRVTRSGPDEALARLELSEAFVEDLDVHAVHPALLDLGTGFALGLIDEFRDSPDLWVPLSYRRVRVHGNLPRTLWSRVRRSPEGASGGGFASFDVQLIDDRGEVLVEVEQFSMRRTRPGKDFRGEKNDKLPRTNMEGQVTDAGPAELSLAERAFRHNLALGIRAEEGLDVLERVLGGELGPQTVVSPIDPRDAIHQAEAVAAESAETGERFDRPELDSEYVEPSDEIERALVGFWQELLGVDRVGVRDSFFDLGGHSLIAVRLFAKIKKAFQVEFPISVLFQAPTVEACAGLIRESIGDAPDEATNGHGARPRFTHLVPMHPGEGGGRTPFFLVAGMFGNVLNLRHLAHLVGEDRPFYGLQARGLYGDHEPHGTFVEMARDYIAELRLVQPHGPYMLGGFSGGGIAAYEMAQQLREAGEEVSLLVFLDTPLPHSPQLSSRDKLVIQLQRLRRQGPAYIADWARNFARWSREQREAKLAEDAAPSSTEFRSAAIEQAFRTALSRYELKPLAVDVALFRPRLDEAHVLGPGRVVDSNKQFVFADNGWEPFVRRLEVHEVPGDHDGMVLEPNVRVLAARLRRCMEAAEDRAARAAAPEQARAPARSNS